MLNCIKINLNDFAKLQDFARRVTKYSSAVEMWHSERPEAVYCAKSIMSIMAIDLSSPVYVRIVTMDEEEVDKFYEEMQEVFA